MLDIKLESQPCPLECEPGDHIVLTGRDLLHNLPGEFTVVRCDECGLMRTNPRPVLESMSYYYPDDYAPYVTSQLSAQQPSRGLRTRIRPLMNRTFNFRNVTLPSTSNGRLLEVGCASGSFLREMADKGWHVEGIEFSASAALGAAKHGYRVHAGPLESAPEPASPFDLIVGWMVLEHLYDPIAGLQKLRRWAKPGATLVLSVPNAAAWEFGLFKKNWYGLHLPNHLYHFTPESLGNVLRAAGWVPTGIRHQRIVTNLIASTGNALRERDDNKLARALTSFPSRPGRWHYVLYPLALLLASLGQTGRMTVIARPS